MTLARVLAVVIALGFCSTVSAADVACKDGTTSKGGQGACSGHGGIDKKATKKANKEEKKSDKKGKKEEQKAEKKAGEKPDKSASAAPRERSTSPRAQGGPQARRAHRCAKKEPVRAIRKTQMPRAR
jgi:hypothetical protein